MAIAQYEAEYAVLGSILIDPAIMSKAAQVVSLDDFSVEAHRLIYKAALTLYRLGEPVDPITIRSKVGKQYSRLMADLMDVTPTSANWREYAEIMHKQATLQRLQAEAQKILDAVELDECRPAAAAMDKLLSDGQQLDSWTMSQMMESFMASQDPDAPKPEYIGFGLEEIDRGTYAQRGDVVVLGGYPSDGKTALSLMMAYAMADGHKVGFFSLETNKAKIRDRLMAYAAQVEFDKIKHRSLSEADWKSVMGINKPFTGRDLTVIDLPGATVTEIAAISKAYGFEVIFIDYVQLVQPEGAKRFNRSEQMAEVSRDLHTFAQRSGTTVIELAQLSRPEKATGWREPTMHDLKESGQFEQDADLIFLLCRPNPKDKAMDQEEHRILRVAKNKEGRWGRWVLAFDGARQTFRIAKIHKTTGQVLQEIREVTRAAQEKETMQQITFQELDTTSPENKNLPF